MLKLLKNTDRKIIPEFFTALNEICIKNSKGERNYIETATLLLDDKERKDKLTSSLIENKKILEGSNNNVRGLENKKKKEEFNNKLKQIPLLLNHFTINHQLLHMNQDELVN